MSLIRRRKQAVRAHAEEAEAAVLPTCWRCMKPFDRDSYPVSDEGHCCCVMPVPRQRQPRNDDERWHVISAHIIEQVHREVVAGKQT